jgi:hypothetical protein
VSVVRKPQISVILAAVVWIAMMGAWPADAASMNDSLPSMDVVRSRLNLTPEQETQIQSLFQRRKGELQQTRDRVEQASSRAEKRAALREAKQQGDVFNSQVEKVLTTQQVSDWRELRKETREKLKERAQEKRESQ